MLKNILMTHLGFELTPSATPPSTIYIYIYIYKFKIWQTSTDIPAQDHFTDTSTSEKSE